MKKFDLNELDFRTLRTLKLVHDLGSFTAAAERLSQNQSTISYAIGRLREAFGDPLFVREGRGIAPTPRCEEIVAGIDRLFDQLAELAEPAAFDPAAASNEITISCNHYERSVILPGVIRRLRADAPNLKLRVIQARMEGHRQLQKGECDLLLSPVAAEFDGLFRRRLIEDRYVCVLDPSNPLASGPLSFGAYAAAAHVFISYEGTWRPSYRDLIEARGVAPRMVIDLPSSGEIGRLIAGTDLVATVTNLIAQGFGDELVIRSGPFDSRILVHQFWTTRTHHSRVHGWLRDIVAEEAARLERAAGIGQPREAKLASD